MNSLHAATGSSCTLESPEIRSARRGATMPTHLGHRTRQAVEDPGGNRDQQCAGRRVSDPRIERDRDAASSTVAGAACSTTSHSAARVAPLGLRLLQLRAAMSRISWRSLRIEVQMSGRCGWDRAASITSQSSWRCIAARRQLDSGLSSRRSKSCCAGQSVMWNADDTAAGSLVLASLIPGGGVTALARQEERFEVTALWRSGAG